MRLEVVEIEEIDTKAKLNFGQVRVSFVGEENTLWFDWAANYSGTVPQVGFSYNALVVELEDFGEEGSPEAPDFGLLILLSKVEEQEPQPELGLALGLVVRFKVVKIDTEEPKLGTLGRYKLEFEDADVDRRWYDILPNRPGLKELELGCTYEGVVNENDRNVCGKKPYPDNCFGVLSNVALVYQPEKKPLEKGKPVYFEVITFDLDAEELGTNGRYKLSFTEPAPTRREWFDVVNPGGVGLSKLEVGKCYTGIVYENHSVKPYEQKFPNHNFGVVTDVREVPLDTTNIADFGYSLASGVEEKQVVVVRVFEGCKKGNGKYVLLSANKDEQLERHVFDVEPRVPGLKELELGKTYKALLNYNRDKTYAGGDFEFGVVAFASEVS